MSEPDLGIINDEDVTEAVKRIAKDDPDGMVQPEAVVEAAADPESPLHRFFEWNDGEAAHQYRLQQARQLVVRIKIEEVEGPPMVNVRVQQADGSVRRGYVPTARAVADPDLYAQIRAEAHRGVQAYRNRLAAFSQAASAVSALDAALEELS